ncbi:hypothetical protein KP509_15G075900 [Ceratopteris richardii]|uniref:Amine oxidase domain-containing protein n=1 Tax=Ceratopteris richardii TaxID=49495 RepID=A0A8T2T9T8_CERRI|nr:hypothetical protein KP509_15G075900 [Ceratopteris richardii]KAH7405558.1 hypothetical protein KP509_15G075900 [Ceratopteris richardii]
MESASTDILESFEAKFSTFRQESRPTVIVVGAGLAGLHAAHALQKFSCEVTVLESRGRLGGRVHTDSTDGFPVDMGASWLHGVCEENPLSSLIGQLGLPLYRTSGDDSILYDHDLESYALFDMDGQQVVPDTVVEVGETFRSLLQEAKNLREEYVDDMSVSQAFAIVLERRPDLRMEGLAHKVLQWYICRLEGWFAADADKFSLHCIDEEELLVGGHGLMINGYAPVISALADGLDIRLDHRVNRIVRESGTVQVHTEDGKVFKADAAVITVPLGVLKAKLINFEPNLPEWKESAIRDLEMGNENKIALFFDNVFWPNVEFLGVVAPTSYGCSYFLNLHKATGHPVLVYMPSGSLADDIEKLPDEVAASFAVHQLRRILPDAKEPVRFLVSHWGTDINSLGSYSYDAVGKPQDLYTRIRKPVENLFFAGEATSDNFPGTAHGAFATGLMAAEDCRRYFNENFSNLAPFQPVMAMLRPNLYLPLQISRM